MKNIFVVVVLSIFACLFFTGITAAQTERNATAGLFDSDSILQITLSGNVRDLLNDRSDNSKYHSLIISYQKDSTEYSISAEAKTRGHFRKLKGNCLYPPLLVHFFNNDTLNASVFNEQKKLKLVMPCMGDEYTVNEWLVYKLYNLVTSKSFNARLIKITLNDIENKKASKPFYGIFLEDENQMAKRNDAISVSRKIKPEDAEPDDFLTMAMFEYLIGNTDWGVQYLQNIKLIAADSTAVPTTVPYDFDQAGIVGSPYAQPAEELEMSSVKQRRYRGYCMQNIKKFDSTIALYNRLKPAIYNLYTSCALLDAKYLKTTIKYIDDFYATINNPAAFKKEFSYPCNKDGTGNIVIKGLKED